MSVETLLLLGIVGSLSMSASLWLWLRRPLWQLLEQLCDRPGSTDFWARYMLAMLVLAPLVVTLFFMPIRMTDSLTFLRRELLALLIGQFAAFALVGRSLFKAIREEVKRADARAPQP